MKKGKTKHHVSSSPRVSLLIVTYHSDTVLLECIESIIASKPKVSYEIIVIDNAPTTELENILKQQYSKVLYVKSPENKGFGGGVNLGAKRAQGDFLCLLNPDIIVEPRSLDTVYDFSSRSKNVGVVSAVMMDKKGMVPELLGAAKLTPLRAIFSFSFLHTLFPNNPIARDFWIYANKTTSVKQAQSVPLGMAMIKRSIFEEISGFDEQFFLYYEDFDFDRRVEEAGYRNYLLRDAPVIHLGGKGGTASVSGLSEIHKKSRFLYFQKYYGFLPALLTTAILSVSKNTIYFLGIMSMAAILLCYRLSELMMFIGDFAWFYLSARDMLLTGNIPLVGITSSHTWLHQGPLWTYLLGIGLAVSQFNPLSGGIIAVLFGLGSVVLIYLLGKVYDSPRLGLLAALLYATSPLVIIHARMPYHTAPIPFFTLLLLYSLLRVMKGNAGFFPLVLFSLGVLYNLELATVVYWGVVLGILVFGLVRKASWIHALKKKKIVFSALLAIIFPFLPIFLYDIQHGFPQTFGYAAWMGYKVLTLFGFPPLHDTAQPVSYASLWQFFAVYMQRLYFLPNLMVGVSLFGISTFYVFVNTVIKLRNHKLTASEAMVALFLGAGILGFFAARTTSEAYLPMLFPFLIFSLSLICNRLLSHRIVRIPVVVGIVAIVVVNTVFLLRQNYLMARPAEEFGYGPTFATRQTTAETILSQAAGNRYTIKGRGPGSQFESYTMPYEYLTWYLGESPSRNDPSIVFFVTDMPKYVILKKESL